MQPCKRKGNHRHVVAWEGRGHSQLTDRCRSLLLWSTLAFHVLAGDEPRLDGKPFADKGWAEQYLEGMAADRLARGTARGIRRSLARRAAREEEGK